MASFICRNAPWRIRDVTLTHHRAQGFSHAVVSDTAEHSLHRSEKQAKSMADRLNYLAAHEVMTGREPNHFDAYVSVDGPPYARFANEEICK